MTSPRSEPAASGWNPSARLRCMHCAQTLPLGPSYQGCPDCTWPNEQRSGGVPVEVDYDDAGPGATEVAEVAAWLAAYRQPIARTSRVSLGRPVETPLLQVADFGSDVYVKNETLNPTWGHKDRLHEVAVGAARLLGARGILATSTGNHGAAAAAHASASGLPSVVFCHERASSTAMLMITAYGGVVAQLSAEQQKEAVVRLVDEGWFPATSMDPEVAGRANPYGAEGYKEIAYEIVRELGGMPTAVIVPTASGDTIYGVAKGFAEVSEFAHLSQPLIVAGQPSSADALVRSHQAGHRVEVPGAFSIALSVADPVSGRQAMLALQRWNGEAVSVSEDAIREAAKDYAHAGILVEPASAVSLAAYRALVEGGKLKSNDSVVLLATSSGAKWPRELAELNPTQVVRSSEQLIAALATAVPN